MKRWLVTGGAGYIGSHVVRDLLKAGAEVVVFDDLSTGAESYIPESVRFINGNLKDTTKLTEALVGVCGVIHLAAYKIASESFKHAFDTYESNVEGSFNLIRCMKEAKVSNIVFSSSAAVYGNLQTLPARETSPCDPQSPYASSKHITELMIRDLVLAKDSSFPLQAISFRYFNVVGIGYEGLTDRSPYSLFSIVLDKFKNNRKSAITGNDYNTPDGTPIRDFIHVADISSAHVAAAQLMEKESVGNKILNLSTGMGISVLEVMNEFKKQLGPSFDFEFQPRRPGDLAASYGDSSEAKKALGWSASKTLSDMVTSVIPAKVN
jgi:UDP-glucose 4-epimerase